MDTCIEILKQINIGQIIVLIIIGRWFYNRLDAKLEKLSIAVNDIDKRLCKIEVKVDDIDKS